MRNKQNKTKHKKQQKTDKQTNKNPKHKKHHNTSKICGKQNLQDFVLNRQDFAECVVL